MSTRNSRDELGVTLIELLVAMSIMGLLITALTSAIFVGFRSTRDTHTSLDQSNTEQLITTVVTKDIQAANAVVVPPTTSCGGEAPRLELTTRSDALVTSPLVTVVYALRANGELLRCKGAAASTVARGVADFAASGTTIVSTSVTTVAGTDTPAYQFSFEVRRRQS